MEPLLISAVAVAFAELGDKTQFLAILLAARYRQPLAVGLALILATVASNALGGAVALALSQFMKPDALRWVLCVGFVGLAAWSLATDTHEDKGERPLRFGVFGTTLVAFFLGQLGAKAQVATIVLAAQSKAFVPVVAGTTLGALIACVPAVFLGSRYAEQLPVGALHWLALAIFAGLAFLSFTGGGAPFGF